MKAPIPPRSKPLSYGGLKSVIKSMSVEKRQEIHNNIPSLRATNSILPYTIDEVRITSFSVKINETSWSLEDKPKQSNPEKEEKVMPNQTTIRITDLDTMKRSRDFPVQKSVEEALEQCFNVYCKNGSVIRELDLCHIPKFLCEKEEAEDLKLNISKLEIYGVNIEKFDNFIRFADLDKLERITLTLYEGSRGIGKELAMLEKPVIINCKDLFLKVSAPSSLINYYIGLKNQYLVLQDEKFKTEDLQKLVENWKSSNRPIGTRFKLFSRDSDKWFMKMLDRLSQSLETFPVDIQRESTQIKGIGMKIDENRDLVVYLSTHEMPRKVWPVLKLEVMESGFAEKNRDTDPNISN